VTSAKPELFPGTGSAVPDETRAVLAITDRSATEDLTAAVSVIVAELPAARLLKETVRAFPVPAQTPPELAAHETKLVSCGRESVSVTPVLASGPLFVSVIAYVTSLPMTTGSGEATSVRTRLAPELTVTVAVDVLSEASGSDVFELMAALFVIELPAGTPVFTWATSVTTALAPTESVLNVIVRVFPVPPQTPLPVELQETYVRAAGRMS
jgi:hypothetical protein